MLTYRVGIRSFQQLCTILAHLAPKNVQMMCMVLYANLRPCTSYTLRGRTAVERPQLLLVETLAAHVRRDGLTLLLQPSGEHGHQLGAEHHHHAPHGEEEASGRSPASIQVMPLAVLVNPASGDDAVDVRMVVQVLALQANKFERLPHVCSMAVMPPCRPWLP